jgi:hypothetical protein
MRTVPLLIFSICGLYLLALFLPTYLLLKGKAQLTDQELAQQSPRCKWLPQIHSLFSLIAIVAALVISLVIVSASSLPEQADYVIAFGVWITSVNAFNGLFEVLTSVSPSYGVIIKRHYKQRYICDDRVRKLGWVRLLISLVAAIVVVGAALVIQME